MVQNALMATLGLVLQEEFTEEVKQSWIVVFKLMSNIMVRRVRRNERTRVKQRGGGPGTGAMRRACFAFSLFSSGRPVFVLDVHFVCEVFAGWFFPWKWKCAVFFRRSPDSLVVSPRAIWSR